MNPTAILAVQIGEKPGAYVLVVEVRKVQVYLDDETYGQLLELKKKGKIKSLSEFLRSIILLYLTSRPVSVPVKMVEEQVVVYRKRRLVKPSDERRKLWVEVQKELKKVFAKR